MQFPRRISTASNNTPGKTWNVKAWTLGRFCFLRKPNVFFFFFGGPGQSRNHNLNESPRPSPEPSRSYNQPAWFLGTITRSGGCGSYRPDRWEPIRGRLCRSQELLNSVAPSGSTRRGWDGVDIPRHGQGDRKSDGASIYPIKND